MKNFYSALLFLLFPGFTFSADTIFVNTSSLTIDLLPGKNLEYVIDKEGKLSFEELLKKNFSSDTSGKAFTSAAVASVIWIKFTLTNTQTIPVQYLAWWNPLGNFYIPAENGTFIVKKTGRFLPFRFRDVKVTEPLVPLFLKAGETKSFYAKITQGQYWLGDLSDMGATLFESKSYLGDMTDKNWEFGIYFGILFFIALYNLIFFFTLRDRSYLYYVLAIFSLALLWANNNNYTFRYLFPESGNARAYTGIIGTNFIFLTSLFYIAFTSHYLRTKEILPRWHKILKGMMGFVIAIIFLEIVLRLIGSGGVPFSVDRSVAIVYLFTSVVVAFVAYRKKYMPAKLFLWGNGILFISIFLAIFNKLIPFHLVFGHISIFQAGTIAQVMLFSLGLAKRINVIRDEHEKAQEQVIRQLKENEELKDKVNRELEEKVRERTAEIALQKKLVEEKNKDIIDSIQYAKRIQQAILPKLRYIDRSLKRLIGK